MMGMKRLSQEFDIEGTFVVSEDEDYNTVRRFAPSNFNIITAPNNPVSDKFNAGFFEAMKTDFDYLLIMGSDDLLSNDGLRLLIDTNKHYVGFGEMAIYGTQTSEWRRYKYDSGRLIGAGRLIKREALESFMNRCVTYFRKDRDFGGITYKARQEFETSVSIFNYLKSIDFVVDCSRPFNQGLWEKGLNRGLDNSSELRLVMKGYVPNKIESEKVHILDIKTDQNITNFDKFLDLKPNSDPTWFLSNEELHCLKGLKYTQD